MNMFIFQSQLKHLKQFLRTFANKKYRSWFSMVACWVEFVAGNRLRVKLPKMLQPYNTNFELS
jgi:hypothetical protein